MNKVCLFFIRFNLLFLFFLPLKAQQDCTKINQYRVEIDKLNTNIDLNSYQNPCNITYLKETLNLLNTIALFDFNDLPQHLDNPITRKLLNPIKFFKTNNVKIVFNNSGPSCCPAFFHKIKKEIHLTEDFFKLPEVERLSILMHEISHNFAEFADHTNCRHGQLQNISACDYFIGTNSGNSGSYGYQFWFLRLIAETQNYLSFEQKTEALRFAEFIAGHRVNLAKNNLISNDLLVFSFKESNNIKLAVYDPLTQSFKFNDVLSNGLIKISEDKKNSGTLLFYENGIIKSFNAQNFFNQNQIKTLLLNGIDNNEISKIRTLYNSNARSNRYAVINKNNKIFNEQKTNDEISFQLIPNIPDFNELYLLDNDLNLASDNNYLYILSQSLNLTLTKQPINENISFIYPNFLGNQFYFINNLGEAFLAEVNLDPISLGFEGLSFFEVSHFASIPITKIKEGSQYSGVLDVNNNFFISSISDNDSNKKWTKIKFKQNNLSINNFVFNSSFYINSPIYLDSPSVKKFKEKCLVSKIKIEPWFKRPVGINKEAQMIVFEKNNCLIIDENIKDFKFTQKGYKKSKYEFNHSSINIEYIN